MTQSLKIDTGEIRLAVNDDPNRLIVFNPSDVLFAERFYQLAGEFKNSLTEYQSRMSELEKITDTDANGVFVNVTERMELMKEINTFMREKIDALFGAGTSQAAFGDALNMDAFTQFFEGITPFIKVVRADKVGRYTGKTYAKRK